MVRAASRNTFLARLAIALVIVALGASSAQARAISFVDFSGARVEIDKTPKRVVSLVPAVTEAVFALGAGRALVGITYHTALPPETNDKTIVGGSTKPNLARIAALRPEIVFVAERHRAVRERFAGTGVAVIDLKPRKLADLYSSLALLGLIFDRRGEAARIEAEIKAQLAVIAQKTARIPPPRRRRVIMVGGRDRLTVPGDDAPARLLIRAAGGVPPRLGRSGAAIPISLEEWRAFDPQAIYTCGQAEAIKRLVGRLGWREVEAVRKGRIYTFPCALTDRLSVNAGRFAAWLAARVYADYFAEPESFVLTQGPIGRKKIELGLDYVRRAGVVRSIRQDFVHQTLLIDFDRPMKALSTLEGIRSDLKRVGNHSLPPPAWGLDRGGGLVELRAGVLETLGLEAAATALMFTGADLDNLAVGRARFKALEVIALTTAGVAGNALRTSQDQGRFYEPGTINVILLTNHRLTERAMARAVITAVEAKTAVLQDLDIRSSAQPRRCQATGTGTDNIIVVEGAGRSLDLTGGHTKLGELIAAAVYEAIREAIGKQNGIRAGRNVFRRLAERRIRPFELLARAELPKGLAPAELIGELEEVLLDRRYAALIETAFALDDAYLRGQIGDLTGYFERCRRAAAEIVGRETIRLVDRLPEEDLPPALKAGLNALIGGLVARRPGQGTRLENAASAQRLRQRPLSS